MHVLGLALALALLAAPPEGANPYLSPALEKIRALDETEALRLLDRAIAWPNNTPDELARSHLLVGLAHAGLSHRREAIAAFRNALKIDPRLKLPERSSPTVHDWWKAAGGLEADAPLVEPKVERVVTERIVVVPLVSTSPPEAPQPRTALYVAGALAGAAALALGGGLTFGALSNEQVRGAKSAQLVGDAVARRQAAIGDAQTANRLFIAGGALAVAAGVTWAVAF